MKRALEMIGIVISILITIGIMSIGNASASEETGNTQSTLCGTMEKG